MAVEARGRAGVVLVPELHELPSLFLPDPERARRAGRVATWLRRERSDVVCDLGGGGRTAADTAEALRAAGCERALVLASPPGGDRDGELFVQRVLEEALERGGIRVELVVADEDPLDLLARRLGPREARSAPAPDVPLLLLENAATSALACFAADGDGTWSRRGVGRAGPLPARVHRLRLAAPAAGAAPGINELIAFVGWAQAPQATIAAARAVSVGRARLVGLPRDRAEWRTLREVVVGGFPALTPELDLVLGWREQDVRPLHELYAGRGLQDVNARLVENLSP